MNAEDREKILAKIRKCMALSASPEPGEAAAALRMAQRIMDEHGIKTSDVEASEVGTSDVRLGKRRSDRFYSWAHVLATVVCDAFGVSVGASRSKGANIVRFYGVNGADQVAAYAFEVLFRKVRKERKNLIKRLYWSELTKDQKTVRADAWATGWVYGAAENVTPKTRKEDEDRKVRAKMEDQSDGKEASKVGVPKELLEERAFLSHGFHEGKKYQLRRGVAGDADKIPALPEGKEVKP